MVQKSNELLTNLYLADETAWLDAMAALVRDGRLNELDYPHLAEYLDDMAKRDRKEVSSRLRILLVHVLEWTYQQDMRSSSWQTTVLNQQAELEEDIESGVLRKHAEESLAEIYRKAVKYAIRETRLPASTFPAECPWTLEQLMSAEVLVE